MLDIKVIRQDPERVKAAMKSRNKDMDKEIDEILEIDVERRAINAAVDNMKAEQNRVSKLIPQYKNCLLYTSTPNPLPQGEGASNRSI